jgi:hypothetical protein
LSLIGFDYFREAPENDYTIFLVPYPKIDLVFAKIDLVFATSYVYSWGWSGFAVIMLMLFEAPGWVPEGVKLGFEMSNVAFLTITLLPSNLILEVILLSCSLWWIICTRARVKPCLDESENKLSIGQMAPMIFIALVFIAAVEIWNGMCTMHSRK